MSLGISISNSIQGFRSSGGGVTPFVNEYSMSFDGVDEYVEVGSPTSIQSLTSAITISFWIKAPRVFTTNYYTPLSKGEYAAVGSQWSIKVNTANARNTSGGAFTVFPNSNAITDIQSVLFPTPVDDNQWHHMMFVNDGTDLKVYIDGQLEATALGKGRTLYNGNRSLKLGRLTSTSSTGLLKGNLDEVAIFGTALQLSDAQTIYNGGVPTDLTSLSPLSWWRMGDGDTWNGSIWTLTDNGSGGNDAISVNMEEADRLPISPSSFSLNSFSFDGVDEYIDIGDISDIKNINTLSIGFWFKYNSISTSADGLITKDDSPRVDGNWYIALQSNQVRFLLQTANGQDALNSTTLTSGTWYHTLCVWNGSTMKIYINGTLNNSISVTNATGTLGSTNDSVRIGRRTTDRLNGSIDEVAVWNTDQSSNVSTIFNNGTPNDISSLSPISWWRMGEEATWNGSTWTLTDQGSGGNDATSVNMEEADKTGDQAYVI